MQAQVSAVQTLFVSGCWHNNTLKVIWEYFEECFCVFVDTYWWMLVFMGTFWVLWLHSGVSARQAVWGAASTGLSAQQKYQLFLVQSWKSFDIFAGTYLYLLVPVGTTCRYFCAHYGTYALMQVSVCEWLLAVGCLPNKSTNCLLSAQPCHWWALCIPSTFYLPKVRSSWEAKHINCLISFGSTGCLCYPQSFYNKAKRNNHIWIW